MAFNYTERIINRRKPKNVAQSERFPMDKRHLFASARWWASQQNHFIFASWIFTLISHTDDTYTWHILYSIKFILKHLNTQLKFIQTIWVKRFWTVYVCMSFADRLNYKHICLMWTENEIMFCCVRCSVLGMVRSVHSNLIKRTDNILHFIYSIEIRFIGVLDVGSVAFYSILINFMFDDDAGIEWIRYSSNTTVFIGLFLFKSSNRNVQVNYV